MIAEVSEFLTPARARLRAQRRHRIKIKNLTITLAAGVKFATKKDKEKAVPTRIATIMALSECNPEVLDMRPSQSTDATEKRRQLLKGALGASTVVSLGYSGSVAAASITCIAKTETSPEVQFHIGPTPPETSNLEWKAVQIQEYSDQSAPPTLRSFCLIESSAGNAYYEVSGGVLITTPTETSVVSGLTATGNPTQAWVLLYFDPISGDEIGTYPTLMNPAQAGGAPASIACLNSVNAANLRSSSNFGG